jgi:hypothetical protein
MSRFRGKSFPESVTVVVRLSGRAWRARWILAGLALAALLFSCSNMLSGTDITDEISTEVIDENAERISAYFKSSPSSGGTLSLNGPQKVKVGIPFSLTATAKDDYSFVKWVVSGSGEVEVSPASGTETTVSILKGADDIRITGTFVARPTISDISPDSGETVELKSAYVITFSQAMDQSSFNADNITIQGKDSGIPTQGFEDLYDQFTITSTDTQLTITPINELNNGYTIKITISSDVCSASGVTMKESKTITYYTKES